MTTTPEPRTATLSDLVAEEIRALLGRRRMSQAQLARAIDKTEMWVSHRLRGKQPIDVNDMALIAGALGVGVQDLFPPPEVMARVINDPSGSSGQIGRTEDPTEVRHVAPRPFVAPRRDPARPASTVPPNRRRPTTVRSPGRPMSR